MDPLYISASIASIITIASEVCGHLGDSIRLLSVYQTYSCLINDLGILIKVLTNS